MKLILLIPGALLILWLLWNFITGLTANKPSNAEHDRWPSSGSDGGVF